jgi:hypothetical protein
MNHPRPSSSRITGTGTTTAGTTVLRFVREILSNQTRSCFHVPGPSLWRLLMSSPAWTMVVEQRSHCACKRLGPFFFCSMLYNASWHTGPEHPTTRVSQCGPELLLQMGEFYSTEILKASQVADGVDPAMPTCEVWKSCAMRLPCCTIAR